MIRRALVALAALVVVAGAGYAYLQHSQPGWWVRLGHPLDYRADVVGYAHIYHLDPALVAAVIYEESRFRPDTSRAPARSASCSSCRRRHAASPCTPAAGKFRIPQDLYVPDLNIRYGCWYLAHLQHKYAGRPNAGDLALAAYNAGQANVDSWIAQTPPGQRGAGCGSTATRDYVAAVRATEQLYRRAYDLR